MRRKYCVNTNYKVIEDISCGSEEETVSEVFVIAGRNRYG